MNAGAEQRKLAVIRFAGGVVYHHRPGIAVSRAPLSARLAGTMQGS
jgi:hypothetical protein